MPRFWADELLQRRRPSGSPLGPAATAAVLCLLPILQTACRSEVVPEANRPTQAHQQYTESLAEAGLAHTALGRAWIEASRRSITQSSTIDLPYREVFYVNSGDADGRGFRFRVEPGRRIEIDVGSQGPEPFRTFVDLFRVGADPDLEAQHVATADVTEQRLVFEPREAASYVLRIHPELLREGTVQVTIEELPSLRFPVVGFSAAHILSRFGAARDGGRRRHHGVDIFAPRHTPVTAASRGRVTRVDESPRGGRVVWMRDLERPLYHYYAHLETQEVEAGTEVEAGDIVGTVGNSGNARTTKPHLHFGLYARGVGPLDPWDYLFDHRRRASPIRVNPDLLGRWARVSLSPARFRPLDTVGDDGPDLPQGTAARVLAAVSRSYRVQLPDGDVGWVVGEALEGAQEPLQREAAGRVAGLTDPDSVALFSLPSARAVEICRLRGSSPVSVLGAFGGFLLLSSEACGTGWARSTR